MINIPRRWKTALAIATLFCTKTATATEISIESADWQVASPALSSIIVSRSAVPLDVECTPLQVHPLEDGLLAVTTNPLCRASDVGAIWLVDPVAATVVVEGAGYLIRTTRPRLGPPVITVIGGRANTYHEERWERERRDGEYARRFYRYGPR